jgi:hypothetical protein
VKGDLLAGRKPPPKGDGITVAGICNRFLNRKQQRVQTGEITRRTFADYHATCTVVVKAFDPRAGGQGRLGQHRVASAPICSTRVGTYIHLLFASCFGHPSSGVAIMSRAPGAKTLAIRKTIRNNPGKPLKEVSAMLKEQGFDVSAGYISKIKSRMQGKGKKRKKAATPAPEAAAAPAIPKDAVSIGLLQKAKKLAAQFSSIKEAKAAIDALAQILD